MDFFDYQEIAKRRTRWLVVYFALAVLAIVVVLNLAAGLAVYYGQSHFLEIRQLNPARARESRPASMRQLAYQPDPALFLWVTVGTLGLIVISSWVRISQLSHSGAIATSLGGRLVDPQTEDPAERRLLNVVEEMAIASGIPVPDVYLLPNEKGINAFAAGLSHQNASIGVTAGCLQLLTRDELQGVIAHEFSHILNGDMRLNTRLIGWIFGILCLAVLGRILLQTGSHRGRGKATSFPLFIGIIMLVIGSIGVFFGRLIKSAISRQREFLADAAAVQFTRLPDGLVSALKKIGGFHGQSRLQTGRAEEASHMFFNNALSSSWFQWMATHPPLTERIQRWEPNFTGQFPIMHEAASHPVDSAFLAPRHTPPAPLATPAHPTAHRLTAEVLPQLGGPTAAHIDWATHLIAGLPERWRRAANHPEESMALVYVLLLSPDESLRKQQWAALKQFTPAMVYQAIQTFSADADTIRLEARVPLIELALPALRRLSRDQYHAFMDGIQSLVETDQQIDLFEYALQKMLQRHLRQHFDPQKPKITQFYVWKPLIADCRVLLSALARIGHDQRETQTSALLKGTQALDPNGKYHWDLLDHEACNLSQIDAALNHLEQAAPPLKRSLLHACVQVVTADGVIQPKEAELLRAIGDSFNCPIPPFLTAAPSSMDPALTRIP